MSYINADKRKENSSTNQEMNGTIVVSQINTKETILKQWKTFS